MQTVTNCHRLKLEAADGKMRLTDVADAQTMLRIVQSVPSKKSKSKTNLQIIEEIKSLKLPREVISF